MKKLPLIVVLALLAGCKARNQRSDVLITAIIPPKASSTGSGAAAVLGCEFDTASPEFTPFLPYNPAENRGMIAAVVQNNLTDTSSLNPDLRTNTTIFMPHQAVVDYELIPGGGAPAEQVIPTSGVTVASGQKSAVGIEIFRGVAITPAPGTYIRVTLHLEGKLADGSLVRSSEREYLFQYCTTPGCGLGGIWSADVGGTVRSCL